MDRWMMEEMKLERGVVTRSTGNSGGSKGNKGAQSWIIIGSDGHTKYVMQAHLLRPRSPILDQAIGALYS